MHIYLYVKQHQSTGLLYFGKTKKVDPFKYQGSGKYWKRHLKKYGCNISTIELWGFDNQEDCTRFALEFSAKHYIAESDEWANLKPENGLDGGWPVGYKHSEETIAKRRGRKLSEEHKAKISAGQLGNKRRPLSDETKAKIRAVMLGKNRRPCSEETKAKIRSARRPI
jgi:hypothetical protein